MFQLHKQHFIVHWCTNAPTFWLPGLMTSNVFVLMAVKTLNKDLCSRSVSHQSGPTMAAYKQWLIVVMYFSIPLMAIGTILYCQVCIMCCRSMCSVQLYRYRGFTISPPMKFTTVKIRVLLHAKFFWNSEIEIIMEFNCVYILFILLCTVRENDYIRLS
jgi:hypothetical protein